MGHRWAIAVAIMACATAAHARGEGKPMLARPTAEQLAWHDLEIGMFIHFGIETYEDVETDDFSFPISRFNPEARDTENWVDVAESMGAKYIILVAKHIGGFCLWRVESADRRFHRPIEWRFRHPSDVELDHTMVV